MGMQLQDTSYGFQEVHPGPNQQYQAHGRYCMSVNPYIDTKLSLDSEIIFFWNFSFVVKGSVTLTHSDNENYILGYGCQENKDKTQVQHRWWAVTSADPMSADVRKKIFDNVEDIGFDRESYECYTTTPTAWKKMTYQTCPIQGRGTERSSCWTCSTGNLYSSTKRPGKK